MEEYRRDRILCLRALMQVRDCHGTLSFTNIDRNLLPNLIPNVASGIYQLQTSKAIGCYKHWFDICSATSLIGIPLGPD